MIFDDIIEKSDVILIEGGKKQGKLTLALNKCSEGKNLIISAYQKPVFLKRLNAISNIKDENTLTALSNSKFLMLKEDWLESKIKYGYDFLLEDMKRAINEHSPDNVIFHRLDMMFGLHMSDNISIFMEKLLSLREECGCKFFITVVPSDENEPIIETIEDFSDLNIELKKEKERIIYIKNSIFPVKPDKYYFLYKDNRLLIQPVDKSIKISKTTSVLLISDNKELIELHRYIFGHEEFDIDTATGMTETINKILNSPDLIIYNPKEMKLDLSVCDTIKQQKIHSKLIYISNAEYVRMEDKMKAIESGCYEMFPITFVLGEYILEIEKTLGNNFYTAILNKLSRNKTVNNKKHFCEIVESLYDEKIFFTILKFKSDVKPEEIRKKLRDTDIIYHDRNSDEYILCLINIRKINSSPVIDKLFTGTQQVPEINIYEAIDWQHKKEEICK